MKKEIDPTMAIGVIIFLVLIIGGIFWFTQRGHGADDPAKAGLLKPGELPSKPHLAGGGSQ